MKFCEQRGTFWRANVVFGIGDGLFAREHAWWGAGLAFLLTRFRAVRRPAAMKTEFMKYPNVFRSEEGMKKVMPFSMVGILISIVVLVILLQKFILRAAA